MSTQNIPAGCLPFDAEKAINGWPCVTRIGKKATYLKSKVSSLYPLVFAIEGNDIGLIYTLKGRYDANRPNSNFDLFLVDTKHQPQYAPTMIVSPATKPRIYLSCPITGQEPAAKSRLQAAAEQFSTEYEVVNPMALDHASAVTWADYMKTDIKALVDCDRIYMMNGWQKSKGCCLEYSIAKELGIPMLFEQSNPLES